MSTQIIETVAPKTLLDRHHHGETTDLIDVRTPAEFREVHASIARSVPLDSLKPQAVMSDRGDLANQPLYVICQSGSRARLACERFVEAGFSNVLLVEGGTQAWVAAGLPTVRGQKTISLERQVRMTAGALILLGVALSLVHPAFVVIAGFIGAGLLYSGATDTCGMGMMLAKMPWNRLNDEPVSSSF